MSNYHRISALVLAIKWQNAPNPVVYKIYLSLSRQRSPDVDRPVWTGWHGEVIRDFLSYCFADSCDFHSLSKYYDHISARKEEAGEKRGGAPLPLGILSESYIQYIYLSLTKTRGHMTTARCDGSWKMIFLFQVVIHWEKS